MSRTLKKTVRDVTWPVIGVITALAKEYVAVKTLLDNVEELVVQGSGAGRRYLLGEIPAIGMGEHRLVLALADIGNNIAAVRATLLLAHFPNVVDIVMVGIAG